MTDKEWAALADDEYDRIQAGWDAAKDEIEGLRTRVEELARMVVDYQRAVGQHQAAAFEAGNEAASWRAEVAQLRAQLAEHERAAGEQRHDWDRLVEQRDEARTRVGELEADIEGWPQQIREACEGMATDNQHLRGRVAELERENEQALATLTELAPVKARDEALPLKMCPDCKKIAMLIDELTIVYCCPECYAADETIIRPQPAVPETALVPAHRARSGGDAGLADRAGLDEEGDVMAKLIPFAGEFPDVGTADRIDCRTAFGDWVQKIALGPARYDQRNAMGGKCYLTVPVAEVDDWERDHIAAKSVNWPAEDVRKTGGASPSSSTTQTSGLAPGNRDAATDDTPATPL